MLHSEYASNLTFQKFSVRPVAQKQWIHSIGSGIVQKKWIQSIRSLSFTHKHENAHAHTHALVVFFVSTANPIWGDIFECCFKAQSSKLESLFSLKRGKRDVRALSFELSKMSPQVGLAVQLTLRNMRSWDDFLSQNCQKLGMLFFVFWKEFSRVSSTVLSLENHDQENSSDSRSLLQKSPVKATIFCKITVYSRNSAVYVYIYIYIYIHIYIYIQFNSAVYSIIATVYTQKWGLLFFSSVRRILEGQRCMGWLRLVSSLKV